MLTPAYPVNLVLGGRLCVVVGGGSVAAQKVRGLLEAGARVRVVAPDVAPAVEAMAAAEPERVAVERRPYATGDLDGAWLAISATDEPGVNAAVHADAEAARVWLNAADDQQHCTFTLPARLRRGPLLVTFSTGGQSPAMASWLRERFAAELGPEYETLLELLSEARAALVAEGVGTESLDWRGALDSGMLDLIREGRLAEAKERLQACLSSSSA